MALRNARDYLETEHPHLFNGCNPKVTPPHQATLTLADTYYQLTAATWSAPLQAGFTLAANGLLTYTDVGQIVIFVGLANISVGTAATMTLGLFINGSPIIESSSLFDVQNKTGLIADVDFVTLATNDVVDVRMKSSAAGQVVDITELKLVYK